MKKRVLEFSKVSFEQFKKDYLKTYPNSSLTEEQILEMYVNIKLPARATANSAGYDFYLPFEINMKPGEELIVPTGVRIKLRGDYALFVYPKSGLGTKERLLLSNSVSIIDADYYYSDNEGHIFLKLFYDKKNTTDVLSLRAGKSFVQSVAIAYGISKTDRVKTKRNGGFGSTK